MVGVRNNEEFIEARYHHSDSYYDSCGQETIDIYFNEDIKDIGWKIVELAGEEDGDGEDSRDFLGDGLFCENAYIYNKENDTLEIYRGFFQYKQEFELKKKILNALEENKYQKGKEPYFCHLIMIIDRKKHTKEQVLKAFEEWNKAEQGEDEMEYPEHRIIPLELPENYVQLV